MIDIAKARALCAAATPEPWAAEPMDDNGTNTVWYSKANSGVSIADAGTANDAAFIAAARTLLPEALDEIERERGITTAWKKPADGRADTIDALREERDALKAENAQLRGTLKQISELPNAHCAPAPGMAYNALAAPQTGGDDE